MRTAVSWIVFAGILYLVAILGVWAANVHGQESAQISAVLVSPSSITPSDPIVSVKAYVEASEDMPLSSLNVQLSAYTDVGCTQVALVGSLTGVITSPTILSLNTTPLAAGTYYFCVNLYDVTTSANSRDSLQEVAHYRIITTVQRRDSHSKA